MEVLGTISGGAVVIKRYQIAATQLTAGVPVMGHNAATATDGMVEVMGAGGTAASNSAGITLDTSGTISAASITDSNDLLVSVAVNPDLIIRAKMNNGTTEDTALSPGISTGDATGEDATGVTSIQEGAIFGYDGANVGQLRRAEDASGAVTTNFENTIANGDRFLVACGYPAGGAAAAVSYFNLSTLLTQIDATNNDSAADNFNVFDMEFRTSGEDGINNSFYHFVQAQHCFGNTTKT